MHPRTKQALDLVAKGDTWALAASKTGVAQSTIARAIRRLNAEHCPECGHILNGDERKRYTWESLEEALKTAANPAKV